MKIEILLKKYLKKTEIKGKIANGTFSLISRELEPHQVFEQFENNTV